MKFRTPLSKTFFIYKNRHFTAAMSLYSWQSECLELAENGKSIVFRAPTSAGKSRVSDELMMQRLDEADDGVALVVLPFVALCEERAEAIARTLTNTDIRLFRMYGGQGGILKNWRRRSIVVCTPERANQFITRAIELKHVDALKFVSFDEAHMITHAERGWTIQAALTKLKMCAAQVQTQVVLMSASMHPTTARIVAEWLGAETYETDFRPVDLRVSFKLRDAVLVDGKPTRFLEAGKPDTTHATTLTKETLDEGGSVLVFCSSKVGCDHLAKDMANTLKVHVATHHAGMSMSDRADVEDAFRAGDVRVICCTSTLAMGVNLPARRVIILQFKAYGGRREWVEQVKQMCGRAGRAGLDKSGDAIVCVKTKEEVDNGLRYEGPPVPVTMQKHTAQRLIIETIACGLVKKFADMEYLKSTAIDDSGFDEAIQWCIDNDMLIRSEDTETWRATRLGHGVASSSLLPSDAVPLMSEIRKLQRAAVLSSPFQILYLLLPPKELRKMKLDTNVSPRELSPYMTDDERTAARMIGIRAFDDRFVCAAMLTDLVEERASVERIAQKYSMTPGVVDSIRDFAARRGMDISAVSESCGWETVASVVSRTTDRVLSGSKESTLELTRLRQVGVNRARFLYRNGIKTPADVVALGSADALFTLMKKLPSNVTDALLAKTCIDVYESAKKRLVEKIEDVQDELNNISGKKRKSGEII